MSDGPKGRGYWGRPASEEPGSAVIAGPQQLAAQPATKASKRTPRSSRSWDGPHKGLLVILALVLCAFGTVVGLKATQHTAATVTAQPKTAPTTAVAPGSGGAPPTASAQHQTSPTAVAPRITPSPTYQGPPTAAAPVSRPALTVPTVPMTTMPNLVGMTSEQQVDTALAAAHLNQGAPLCSYVAGSTTTQEVTNQDPAPGTVLPALSAITVDWLLWSYSSPAFPNGSGGFLDVKDSCPPGGQEVITGSG